jgi:hypothetical protein
MSPGLKPPKSAPTGALAQRDDLLRKKQAGYTAYLEHTQQRQHAERAMGSLAKRIVAMDFSDAEGEGELDLEAAHATAENDYKKHLEHANTALDRTKALEAEIEALHERSFSEFAEEASRVTERCDVALQDFVTSYRRAVSAWTAAAEAWAPLCRAVRVGCVPAFPVPEHMLAELLRGEVRAQPPHVEVMEPLGDDPELDDELSG